MSESNTPPSLQESPGSPLGAQQPADTTLDDHERRISHSLYGGLEGLDDNLMPRQGTIPRTIGETDISCSVCSLFDVYFHS